MKIAAHYSHLNGLEYLLVHHPEIWDEINSVIAIKNIDNVAFFTRIYII